MVSSSRRAIFLDRDGVINRRLANDYIKEWGEFIFLPDVIDVLPMIHHAGALAVVVTNQRGIGRGLMSEEALAAIHERMQAELIERTGHRFDAIYHCPHDHADRCDCRKPLPGMLLRAAADLGIDLERSWMIGDSESDIEAGLAAGCRAAKVGSPGEPTRAEISAGSLGEAWSAVMAELAPERSTGRG
jgi:histidinol-phosphate phosphatase family protein